MASTRNRSAFLVGCNYIGTQNELYGCMNDVQTMQALLTDRFSFTRRDIEIMTDAPDSSVRPTGMNIRKALVKMIHEAKKDDILFFYFSGLGTLVPCNGNKQGTASCGNEFAPAIVSCDFDIIKDVEFRLLVNHLPEGATFTFLSDSSHSGGLVYEEKEQKIRDATGPEPNNDGEAHRRSKTFSVNVNSGVQSSGVGPISDNQSSDIGVHLSEIFGSEVSADYRSKTSTKTSTVTVDSSTGQSSGAVTINIYSNQSSTISVHLSEVIGGEASANQKFGIWCNNGICSDNGILLSSCKLMGKSVEVDPNDNQSNAYGAFTNAVKVVLEEYRGQITNRELVKKASDHLDSEGIIQHPGLYCSDRNADAAFLG